jgi:hypothetical protein
MEISKFLTFFFLFTTVTLMILLICNTYGNLNKIILSFFSFSSIFFYSFLYSSKVKENFINNDFEVYYNNYTAFLYLNESKFKNILQFGFEELREPGLGFLHFIIYKVMPQLNIEQLLFFHLTLISILYYIWLKKISKNFDSHKKNLVIVTCFIFFGIAAANQITRQFYASIFILYALTSRKFSTQSIFLFLGTLFHLSTIIIYLVLFFCKKKTTKFILFATSPIIFFYLNDILFFLSNYFYIGKLAYFYIDQNYIHENIRSIYLVSVNALLAVVIKINNFNKKNFENENLELSINAFIVSLILLNLPYAAARLLLPYYGLMLGYVFINSLFSLNLSSTNVKIILFFCIIYKIFFNFSYYLY